MIKAGHVQEKVLTGLAQVSGILNSLTVFTMYDPILANTVDLSLKINDRNVPEGLSTDIEVM